MTATADVAGVAPVWRDLVGQERIVEVLSRAVRSTVGGGSSGVDGSVEGMTHAWLFTGPPGSGRSTAARAFAAALQ